MPSHQKKSNKVSQTMPNLLKQQSFILLLVYRLTTILCYQIIAVVVGWQIYEITRDPLALGLIGLAEVIPYFASALFAGYAVDHYPTRRLGLWSCGLLLLMSVLLVLLSSGVGQFLERHGAWPIYAVIGLSGLVRTFLRPVYNTLLMQLVERESYAKAIGMGTSIFQFAQILGPAIGGGLLAIGDATIAYMVTGVCAFLAFLSLWLLNPPRITPPSDSQDINIFTSINEGLRFVFGHQILLSALALDMFAVLFGGAMALLPAFVADVLHSGPQTLGILRASPAIGAIVVGLWLTRRPISRNAGCILLVSVAGFGLCMMAFALSTSLWVSIAILALSGMLDSVSVVVRSTILQLTTPPDMLGRVSAINGIFIGSSNELGAFESGVAASLFGLIPSVFLGGLVTLAVVAVTAKVAPKLRRLHIDELV